MLRWLIDSFAIGGPGLVAADAVAKATILMCLATTVAAVLGRSAAAVRHRLWGLTLCGLVVLPPLSWSLPGWRLPILPAEAGWTGFQAGWSPDRFESPRPTLDRGRTSPPGQPSPGPPASGLVLSSKSSPDVRSTVAPGPAPREPIWMMPLWTSGFLAAALPALAGVVGNERRRRRSRRLDDPDSLRLLAELTRQLGLRRRIELRTSPVPVIPVTWGIFRPVVLLPEEALHWPEPVRRVVLLHELVHIRRRDVAFLLIGRLAAAVYWFHPLAWYALHRLRVEGEGACDDQVVHLGTRRTDYAQQLVDLVRSLRAAGIALAVPMARKNALEHRIKALFDEGRSHQPLSQRWARALLAGSLVSLTTLALVQPVPAAAGQRRGIAPPPATTARAETAREAQPPAAAPGVAPASEKPPAAERDPALPMVYTYPISITGRAVDPAGKPVPGAHVYLASQRGDYKRVAETTTDAEGRYEFHDVPLPIERAETVRGRDHGAFQVFGQAEGLGFAWRPVKWFYPRPDRANITYVERRDPPEHYTANDKIELDLRFSPAARLSGTVVDDRGNPLPDVRLEIRDCESLTIVDDVIPGWTLDSLNERDSAPPSMKLRTTDAQGRFEFTGLPVDCRFRIDVRAKGFPSRWVYAATTRAPQPDHDGSPVFTGDLKITLATPLDVPVKMVFGDTGAPAPKVAVQAAGGLVSTLQTTDEQGRVTLRLPPGKYRMENWPARGTPYLVTEGELVVGTTPPAEPVVASLRPAGIIEVTVVDAETGAGIPDVDVWQQTDPNGRRERLVFRSWEVATRIAWRESPRTDARGNLRALVEPGKHRIGVGLESYPPSYEVVEARGQEVECRPGETVPLKFTMRKRR